VRAILRRETARRAFIALITALAAPAAAAQTISDMYESTSVLRQQARLESRVNEIYIKAFRPTLTAEEARALSGVIFESPLRGDPVIGYYSDSRRGDVALPAVSLLFFEDLCVAYAWLQLRGYRLETVEEYLTMLKYKNPQELGGRYPPPLEALGIPADAVSDPKVNDLSLRFRNTGYAFILGHELGHVRYRHESGISSRVSQANEKEADQFALDLMRRTSTIPMGAMAFFQAAVFYFENRADYPSDAAWDAYLAKSATHPLSTDRLLALSKAVSASAADFARGQPNRAAAIDTARFIGDRFAEFAGFLNDRELQRAMRARAEKSNLASLRPRRTP
jgi:hypothetical protein